MATIVDVDVILKVIGAAVVAGIGITAIFGLTLYGSIRFADFRRDGRAVGAGFFAVMAVAGVVAFAAAVVLGIVVMANK